MKIIIFAHPDFLDSQSMPRYATMLSNGLQHKGHTVSIWKPMPFFYRIPCTKTYKKWLGYIDQYFVFPLFIKFKLFLTARSTFYVFSDQALGPWVPLTRNRPHVIHCHDFLALKSALDLVPENPISRSGKIYQTYIQKGFSKGKNFISISLKTQADLNLYHLSAIKLSELCYNWLNGPYKILDSLTSRVALGKRVDLNLNGGYIVHIGGNQYYKNRKGIIEIYNSWRMDPLNSLPLVLIGSAPSDELKFLYEQSLYKHDIHFIAGLEDEYINMAYSGACCLLFPSLDEGFGWPIVEAMASGCPVITTNAAPMSEIAGNAGFLLLKRPDDENLVQAWADNSAIKLSAICNLTSQERKDMISAGTENIKRFDQNLALNQLDKIYTHILSEFNA